MVWVKCIYGVWEKESSSKHIAKRSNILNKESNIRNLKNEQGEG